jgi:hypothetical protein
MTDVAMLGTSGYARVANEAYWTPAWCTETLLTKIEPRGVVWEPACGNGAIVKVLERRHIPVIRSDITNYGFACSTVDFLKAGLRGDAETIITNPPYDQAESFIRHALNVTETVKGMVAMLLRNEYDCAAGRVDLFDRPEFAKKLVLTKRPKWSDMDKASPRHNFAWFIWDWQHKGPATMAWGAA